MRHRGRTRFARVVWSHLRQVKGGLLLGALCMLGFTLTELLRPWPLKIIFDHVLTDQPLPPFLSFLGGLLERGPLLAVAALSSAIVLLALLGGMFSYFAVYLTSRIGNQMVYALRLELFARLQRLSLSFHSRARSGELLTRMASDTNALKDAFAEWVLTVTSHLLVVTGMFAIMFALNWRLGLIVLAVFPVLLGTLAYLYRKVRASVRKERKGEGRVAARISEILAAVPLVQAFAQEEYEDRRFEEESAWTLRQSIRTARVEAAASRAVEIISAFGTGAVVLFGSLQVLEGRMTLGSVLVFISYLRTLYKPVRNLAKLSTRFPKAAVSAERIGELLELEPEIQDDPRAVEAAGLKGEIVFENVSFDYGDGKSVLENVSFMLLPGQWVALVGASGVGKSTVVSLILRLYDPRKGSVSIDGVNVKNYRRESLRREIGIVLQDSLLLGATIRENISYGTPDATREAVEEAARLAHADGFIEALPNGYETVLGERGSTLSRGQRQRLALARAVIKRPSILILDEPTSAVDAESEALIWRAIGRVQRGKTTLVIAHRFSAIKAFDQILVLKGGEVVERGTHEELLALKGHYLELFRRQAQ